ncbi:MAG: hypothetical protein JXQ68_02150 [Campylobacterales bacterium]|nr:hypothetical protein [Campylobacterales bacterium]
MASFYFFYKNIRRDLFMLSSVALSGIITATSFLLKVVIKDLNIEGLLLVAILIVGMGAGAAFWLRKIQKEWKA